MTIDKLAHLLVHYSVRVRRGELVRLLGSPVTEPLLVALYREVLRAGGQPLMRMMPDACEELLLREGSVQQLTYLNPLELQELAAVDASIHVLSAPTATGSRIDLSRQNMQCHAKQPLLDLFLQRTADQTLRWVATQFPSSADASLAGMPLADHECFVFRGAFLHDADPTIAWQVQTLRQAQLIAFLNRSRTLRIVTPQGTDLRLRTAGRVWINGDGHENMPDGEVYTGPVEGATEGTVYFDVPTLRATGAASGVRLVFRAGRVVEASAEQGEDFLRAMLDQDAGARVLGEVGLGCNYAIPRPTRHPLLDEKIGGTFHLALGTSYPRTGGVNVSRLHWDLIGDLRSGGRIEADGQVISDNGRFLNPNWPQPEGAP